METSPEKVIEHILISHHVGLASKQVQKRAEEIVHYFSKAKVHQLPKGRDAVRDKIRVLHPEIIGNVGDAVTRGKRILVLGTRSGAGLAEKFQSTQALVCPHFHVLGAMSNGCVYQCQYCYLQGTYRGVHPNMKVNLNYEDMLAEMIRVARKEAGKPYKVTFNMGEKMDSFVFERALKILAFLVPEMARPQLANTDLLCLSKSDKVEPLIELADKYPASIPRVVASWSLNTPYASGKYELGAADITQRLAAAKKAMQAGYRVRLRIDPMIPYESWEKEYSDLVTMIFDEFQIRPEVITLGSLRYENTVPGIGKKRFPKTDLFEHKMEQFPNDKKRLPFDKRMSMYKTMIDRIRKFNPGQPIGICKERKEMWERLGFDTTEAGHNCNCRTAWCFD